jgi:hypothetical protein
LQKARLQFCWYRVVSNGAGVRADPIQGAQRRRDARVRANYYNQAQAASRELEACVSMGEMSAEEAALKANELRNALLEAGRLNSSDIGRAVAVVEKATGLKMEELQAKYAGQLFGKEFATLTTAERDTVFLEIVRACGRPKPRWTRLGGKTRQGRKRRADGQLCFCRLQRDNRGRLSPTREAPH